jgi:putative transposase
MAGPVAKRVVMAHLRGVLEISERRACSIVAADRKMIRYRSRRPCFIDSWARRRAGTTSTRRLKNLEVKRCG